MSILDSMSMYAAYITVSEQWRLWSPCDMLSMCLAIKCYTVCNLDIYIILMSCHCCHVWFGLRLGLVLGLELPSLESKPANNSEKTLRLMSGDDGNGWLLWQVPHAGADRHRLLTSDSSYSNAYWCRPAHSLSNMICRLTHRDAVWHITQIHPKNYFICNKWINKPVQLILY